MRPHTTLQVCTAGKKSDAGVVWWRVLPTICVSAAIFVSSYHYLYIYHCMPVLIPLHVFHHRYCYVSSYDYTCVLILLYLCPHTHVRVSSYCYICVLLLLSVSSYYYISVLMLVHVSYYCMCPPTITCVLLLLYMCPHTAICPRTTIYVSSYYCICVLILMYAHPRTAICALLILYVSSYYISVLILVYVSYYCMCPPTICPPTAIYVPSYCYMCPHTTIYVSLCVLKDLLMHMWNTGVLRELGDVCAVVQFGKLDGNHLSMMLSLVSRDPALWRGEGTWLRGGARDAANPTRFSNVSLVQRHALV
jgi:hypothetical protein